MKSMLLRHQMRQSGFEAWNDYHCNETMTSFLNSALLADSRLAPRPSG